MSTPNEQPISEKDFWKYVYIDNNLVLASILTTNMFYLKYDDSDPLAITTQKWTQLFVSSTRNLTTPIVAAVRIQSHFRLFYE